jgi:hypothetical protein
VKVAEVLVAEAGAAAAAASGEDVAALELVVLFLFVVAVVAGIGLRHDVPSPGYFGCKILTNMDLGLYPHRYKTAAPTESSGSGMYARLRFFLLI